MKNLMLMAAVISLGLLAVGCANSKKPAAANESVMDVGVAPAAAPRDGGYAGPISSAPTNAAPVYVEPAPAISQTPTTAAPAAGAATAGGSSYTVKKGDTLFSISKAAYGNGNQWQRIAQANPGLSPTTLKAGKTIVIP